METTAEHSNRIRKTAAKPASPARAHSRQATSRRVNHVPELTVDREEPVEAGDSYKLEGLDRVVAILDLLGQSDNSLSLAEICRHMTLRKSTAHRALMALERTGLIERAPAHRYRLGLKLYDMGNRAVEQIDLRARVHPFLRKLALRVGHTVHLGVLNKTRVVYIDKIEPINRHVCISSRTGTSNPVYSTSLGKAILAFLTPPEIARTVAGIQFVPFTSKTLTTPDELMNSLERVRRRGFSVDDEEMELGTRCVGAPIFDTARGAVAAVSVSGPASRLTAHCVPVIAEHLIRCCQEISAGLATQEAKLLVRPSVSR
jgi:DNA-binding IclR family transcriptional regulator